MVITAAAVAAIICVVPCPAAQHTPVAPDATIAVCASHPRAWSHDHLYAETCIFRLNPFEAARVPLLLFVQVR